MTTFFGTYFSVKKNFDLWKSGRRSRRASERINKYSTAPGVYDGSVAGLQLFHLFRGSRFPIAVFIIFITIISTPGTTTMNSHAADRGARGMFQYFCVRFKFCFFFCCLLIYGDVPLRRLCEIPGSPIPRLGWLIYSIFSTLPHALPRGKTTPPFG